MVGGSLLELYVGHGGVVIPARGDCERRQAKVEVATVNTFTSNRYIHAGRKNS